MRRFAQYATTTPRIMMTPELVQILNTGADNYITHIHFNRSFVEDGAVPHLGPAVARWYGETIGFWDSEALITWTSNIQGWMAHGAHEHSNALQTVEIYTPRRNDDGDLVGIRHEAVLYDPEVFVEPVRIVQYWEKAGELNEGDPYVYLRCAQTIFPINGRPTPLSPGTVITYTVPDLYQRPWAQIWEQYFEQGMTRPDTETDIFSFD
jgi:hypothetical protein